MTREVYTDEEFIRFSRSYVFVRVMEDTDPEGNGLARRFRIEGTPTLIVLDSRGREVGRIVGGRDASDLIDELEEIIESSHHEKYTV
jgi:hypothetical protein